MLEFVVTPCANGLGSSLKTTAYWHPAGVVGLAYWYLQAPLLRFLFRSMTRAIMRRASALGH